MKAVKEKVPAIGAPHHVLDVKDGCRSVCLPAVKATPMGVPHRSTGPASHSVQAG
jgi:hypothetical protein